MSGAHGLGLAALGRALASREISSVELTTELLGRLDRHRALGAVLASDAEAALRQAAAADARDRKSVV